MNGKALEDSPTSCYVSAGSTVTLEADPLSGLYMFDSWIIKGADVDSEEALSKNKITLTVNHSVLAEATYIEDPDYKKNDEKKDTDKKVKSLTLKAAGPGTAYIIVKSKQGEGQENIAVCKITVTTSVGSIKIVGDANKLISDDENDTGAIVIKMKQGSYDRLYYAIDPTDTTDIGKIRWSAKGGVTVKNGVI